MYGPEMLVFHAVFVAWIIIFFVHLGRARLRSITSVLLYSLAILCGMLAPLHHACRDQELMSRALGASSLHVVQTLEHDLQVSRGSLIILITAIIFLILSTWALLMPRPERSADP